MYLPHALVASVFALQTSAFLVPLEISQAAGKASSDLITFLVGTAQTVDLDCPGCLFAGLEDGPVSWQQDVENTIHLEFDATLEQGLIINGQPVFLSDPSQRLSFALSASQVRASDGRFTEPLPLDFALERLEPISSPFDHDKQMIPVHFTVLAIGGLPIKVDTLAINLVQTANFMRVVQISTIPFSATPGATTCETSSRWSMCRIRAFITARVAQIMDATRAHAETAKGWVKNGCGRGEHGPKFGPRGHGKRPHHHGRHWRARRIGHMLHQTLRFFIIPALLGVIGGLMASAVGMLVGQIIIYCWLRFRRNHQQGSVRIIEILVEDDEKDALISQDEELPPLYQDVEAVIVEEKH